MNLAGETQARWREKCIYSPLEILHLASFGALQKSSYLVCDVPLKKPLWDEVLILGKGLVGYSAQHAFFTFQRELLVDLIPFDTFRGIPLFQEHVDGFLVQL